MKLLLNTQPMNWSELRKSVKNCQFNCPRNKDKFKILFDRKESSLSKIKFIVVSQEPGYSLKKKKRPFENSEDIEEYLISECQKERDNKRTPINRTKDIFREKFNPATEEIYWTHALKCIPKENDEGIHKIWKNCASSSCIKHFINELNLIPSKKIIIIPMGNYALTLCRHVLEEHPLNKVGGISEYIRTYDFEKKFTINDKVILLFPFLHPSNRNRNKDEKIDWYEDKFIEKISELL